MNQLQKVQIMQEDTGRYYFFLNYVGEVGKAIPIDTFEEAKESLLDLMGQAPNCEVVDTTGQF